MIDVESAKEKSQLSKTYPLLIFSLIPGWSVFLFKPFKALILLIVAPENCWAISDNVSPAFTMQVR